MAEGISGLKQKFFMGPITRSGSGDSEGATSGESADYFSFHSSSKNPAATTFPGHLSSGATVVSTTA